MKFGLLNADPETVRYATALSAAGCELVLVDASPGGLSSAAAAGSEVRRVAQWEEALACGADFVLVGLAASEAVRLEQLQRLAQEGMPTLFTHPQSSATLAYLELDMHRQASNVALVPLEATRHRAELAVAAELGPCREVIVERRLRSPSRGEVLARFVRDIGAVRRLTGPCEKVSAMGSLGDEAGPGQIGIQISTTSGALIRWSCGPSSDVEAAEWRVLADGASAEWTIDAAGTGRLQIARGGDDQPQIFEAADAVRRAAEAARTAVGESDNALWREALADLELVEAVERSLRKGRTVELFHEEASEEGTFHGVMAAGGCLLLLLGIGVAITVTMVGPFRLAVADHWPKALLAVLAVFLLLQLLKFVFPPRHSADR